MNTIAVFTLGLLAIVVSAQRPGDLRGRKQLSVCPSYFCETGQCGMFATVADYNGGQCKCPCFGFGGGSGGNRYTNCPRSFCYNGQCGLSDTFSSYQNNVCSCLCSGNGGYGGIIQNQAPL